MAQYYNRWTRPGQKVIHKGSRMIDELQQFGYNHHDIRYALDNVIQKDNVESVKEFLLDKDQDTQHVIFCGYRTREDVVRNYKSKTEDIFHHIQIGNMHNKRSVRKDTLFVGNVNGYINKCNVYHDKTVKGLEFIMNNNESFSVGNCSASSANKCTEIRPPNEKYALAGLRGRADAFIYRIAFTFVNISNNKNEWSKDEIDRITQREKQSIFEYTIRHTPTFVWRDPNVKNEEACAFGIMANV
eukprot:760902_1